MLIVIKLMMWALVIGCIALAVSSVRKLIVYYSIKKNGSFAEGIIVDLKEKGDAVMSMGSPINQEAPRKVYPVVEYIDGNGTVVQAVYMGFVLKGRDDYEEGQKVQIKYDPAKNDRFIIIGDSNFHGNAWGFLVVGTGFAVLAGILLRMTF